MRGEQIEKLRRELNLFGNWGEGVLQGGSEAVFDPKAQPKPRQQGKVHDAGKRRAPPRWIMVEGSQSERLKVWVFRNAETVFGNTEAHFCMSEGGEG